MNAEIYPNYFTVDKAEAPVWRNRISCNAISILICYLWSMVKRPDFSHTEGEGAEGNTVYP